MYEVTRCKQACIDTVNPMLKQVVRKPPELKFRYDNGRFVSDTCCKQLTNHRLGCLTNQKGEV